MDFVVTESGVHAVVDARLVRINAEECRVRAQRLCGERGLPRRPATAASGYSSPPCYAGELSGYFGETGDKKS
jgi:hypothetical protein